VSVLGSGGTGLLASSLHSQKKNNVPKLSVWQAICGSRKHVRTFSPVSSSMSVWNLSSGCAWFSDSQIALRLHVPRLRGRWRSLHRQFTSDGVKTFLPRQRHLSRHETSQDVYAKAETRRDWDVIQMLETRDIARHRQHVIHNTTQHRAVLTVFPPDNHHCSHVVVEFIQLCGRKTK